MSELHVGLDYVVILFSPINSRFISPFICLLFSVRVWTIDLSVWHKYSRFLKIKEPLLLANCPREFGSFFILSVSLSTWMQGLAMSIVSWTSRLESCYSFVFVFCLNGGIIKSTRLAVVRSIMRNPFSTIIESPCSQKLT